MKRKHLKLAIVATGNGHQLVATEANAHLPPDVRLSELDVTKLITCRKAPTQEQAEALAKVLNVSVSAITRRSL